MTGAPYGREPEPPSRAFYVYCDAGCWVGVVDIAYPPKCECGRALTLVSGTRDEVMADHRARVMRLWGKA